MAMPFAEERFSQVTGRGASVTQALYTYREAVVFGVTLFLLLAATGLGFIFGALRKTDVEGNQGSSLIQPAMLTLLSLLLAFGVSMSEIRYESRKLGEIEESNAIGTSYLRAQLLPQNSAVQLKQLLKVYLQKQIESYQSREDEEPLSALGQELTRLQNKMPEVFLVPQPIGATLHDSYLVVQPLDEAERDLVLGFAVGGDAVPVLARSSRQTSRTASNAATSSSSLQFSKNFRAQGSRL